MPVVLRWKGYRFLFYSKEIDGPPHVPILKHGKRLKVWFSNLWIARNEGFAALEVNDILKIVSENRQMFLESRHGHFGY